MNSVIRAIEELPREAARALREGIGKGRFLVETSRKASKETLWNRSRGRWRNAKPDAALTWGLEVSGNEFIQQVARYNAFHPESSVLEIGPGYGRLLKACLSLEVPFKAYCGVDISPTNIGWLRSAFDDPRVSFVVGDIERVRLEERYDVVLSSLTFKHFYPSFEPALLKVALSINSRGRLFFDLREGSGMFFEPRDNITFIRCYSQSEVRDIVKRVGLNLIYLDHVDHDERHRRLLVVAEKP